jgi:hypothetical protein
MMKTPTIKHKVTVELSEPVFKLLEAAAKRRSLDADDITARIIGGILTRGSIDNALNGWGRYLSDRRCVASAGEGLKFDVAQEEGESLRV